MKWIGISGSWRTICPELERDLERETKKTLTAGKGIVTGGALGVDYAATKLALEYAPDGSQIKVLLPTSLEIYATHYRKRATEGVITYAQAEELINQLEIVQKLHALIAGKAKEVTVQTYYLRNTDVVNASDALLAFQVNNSAGTQDTIDKAEKRGVPVQVFRYIVD